MRRITILAAVIAVVVVLWSGAWLYGASVIRQQAEALSQGDGAGVPRLTCEELDVGGWPFWFDATCTNATVASGDLSAEIPEVKATVLVYDPFHLVAVATGPLTLADAFTGSREKLSWGSLEASARLTGWRIARISVIADDLALDGAVGGGDVPLARATHAEAHLLDIPGRHDATRGLAALAAYARLDGLAAPGLAIAGANATFEADISNLPDDVRTYGDADLLRRWQAAGGKLKLVRLKGTEGDQSFEATGDLTLDTEMRPAGQLAIHSRGLVERFGTLVPEQWRGAVLGNPAADGSYSQALTLSNGVIFAGLIPLGTLPSL
jgi:hypothetical protein